MLVIKIEMWPFGSEDYKRELHRGYIWNTGEGTKQRGDYEAQFLKRGKTVKGKHVHKQSQATRFPRLRRGAWDLLLIMMVKAWGKERIQEMLDEVESVNY